MAPEGSQIGVSAVRVAVATAAGTEPFDLDRPLLLDALGELEVDAVAVDWDDSAADWDAYDVVVIRSTWDYTDRPDEFLAWADRVGGRLRNPPGVVRWNAHKSYLVELAAAGVPVIPTVVVPPGDDVELPDGEVVVKPAISVGSRDSARYDPARHDEALRHVARLHRRGSSVLVQPYQREIEVAGESAVVFLGGRYSHAARKRAPLPTADVVDGWHDHPEVAPWAATEEEIAVAGAALDAVPGAHPLLYARIDLVPSASGPLVLEVEAIEPNLFLVHTPGAAGRLAAAIRDDARVARP